MHLAQNGSSKRENRYQNSYCKYALDYCGLFVDKDRLKSKYVRVDTYWHAVGYLLNRYLLLDHGNLIKYTRYQAHLEAEKKFKVDQERKKTEKEQKEQEKEEQAEKEKKDLN